MLASVCQHPSEEERENNAVEVYFLLQAAVNHITTFVVIMARDDLIQQKCNRSYDTLVSAPGLTT